MYLYHTLSRRTAATEQFIIFCSYFIFYHFISKDVFYIVLKYIAVLQPYRLYYVNSQTIVCNSYFPTFKYNLPILIIKNF